MANPQPGTGLFGWLGRQIGHVRKAVHTDPSKPAQPRVLYREDRTEEQELPNQPGVILRRRVIDEVIVERPRLEVKPKAPGEKPGN